MAEILDTLKCRHCTFTVPTVRTQAAGRARSGFAVMSHHVAVLHPGKCVQTRVRFVSAPATIRPTPAASL